VEGAISNYDARHFVVIKTPIITLSARYQAFLLEFVLDKKNPFALSQSSKKYLRDISSQTTLPTPPDATIVNELQELIHTVNEPVHGRFRTAHGLVPSTCVGGGPLLASALSLLVLRLQREGLWSEPVLVLDPQLLPVCRLRRGLVSPGTGERYVRLSNGTFACPTVRSPVRYPGSAAASSPRHPPRAGFVAPHPIPMLVCGSSDHHHRASSSIANTPAASIISTAGASNSPVPNEAGRRASCAAHRPFFCHL
jgi:hypothetical protein